VLVVDRRCAQLSDERHVLAACGTPQLEADRLAGERIYYDRAIVLRQLGLFHEPERALGRITAALTHPYTMARIARRAIFRW